MNTCVSVPLGVVSLGSHLCGCSNSGTPLGKARSDKYTVCSSNRAHVLRMIKHPLAGALNWATGETVAVKEIQLSNIPKAELGEIMVCSFQQSSTCLVPGFRVVTTEK